MTMSAPIAAEEYSLSKSISFRWKFDVSGNPWNVSSNNFFLKEISSMCSLSMENSYIYSNKGTFSTICMAITFEDCQLMLKSIKLVMIHEATAKAFCFYLKKKIGNPHVFSSVKNVYNNESLFTSSTQDWKVEMVYENISMPEHKLLANDFKELLENQKHADFSIKTQNVTFKVHKAILSCRCNVLAKAIESDMIEKQNKEIQSDLWDPAVMKEFLMFIYTGWCKIALNPHQLFELAHYYELDELKVKCINYLQDNMNIKNIVHTLELTDQEHYSLKDLQTLAYSFIEKNETYLIEDPDFQDYLVKSININNLEFILNIVNAHDLDGPLQCAKEFIKLNYKKVLENEKCKAYLSSHGELALDILKYALDSTVKI